MYKVRGQLQALFLKYMINQRFLFFFKSLENAPSFNIVKSPSWIDS